MLMVADKRRTRERITGIPALTKSEYPAQSSWSSVAEVFRAFFKLGATSFGGPIAHLGYFRSELVQRRRWIDEAEDKGMMQTIEVRP